MHRHLGAKPTVKPKAFIVKKQKPVEVQEIKEEKKEEPVIKTVSRLEIVRSAKPQAPVQKQKEQKQQQNEIKCNFKNRIDCMAKTV